MKRRIVFAIAVAVCLLVNAARAAENSVPQPVVQKQFFNGARALQDIELLVSYGSRAMESDGHARAITYIQNELHKVGITDIEQQSWLEGPPVNFASKIKRWLGIGVVQPTLSMTNVIARYKPNVPRRIVVGTHYDSIVRAYRDKEKPNDVMPGANNSASGVALLLETARALSTLPAPPVGIDFVFFDGEEGPLSLGAGDEHWRPLGSPYFAANLKSLYQAKLPEKGVIFDMVCDRDLDLYPEPNSITAANDDVYSFWRRGKAIAPKAFITDSFSEPIGDDHTALNAAGIPSFLVIDFNYEPWFNTTKDTLDKCSATSLEAVGNTLLSYIFSLK